MEKETALALFETFDGLLAWSQEEYEKSVKEAEDEDEEPMDNPRQFETRLDSRLSERTGEQTYRVRVTQTEWGSDPRIVFDAAEEHGVRAVIQNNGIELS
jgi:hypothetical protein